MDIGHKVRVLAAMKKVKSSEIAAHLKITPQGLNYKLDNNTLKEVELEKIASFLGVEYKRYFVLPDGGVV